MTLLIALVVLVEGLIAASVTALAWRWWGLGRFVHRFLLGMLLAVGWCPLFHGIAFGLFRADGPGSDRDAGVLAMYGLASGIMFGFPLGTMLGLTLGIATRFGVGPKRPHPIPDAEV